MLKTMTASLAACVFASVTFAQDTANLPEPTISIDILGFSIGMPADEALAKIAVEFPGVEARVQEEYNLAIDSYVPRNVSVTTPGGTFGVSFTGLQSGNRVYAINRSTGFAIEDRPPLDATKEALIGKYGLPTFAHDFEYSYNYAPEPIALGSESDVRAILDAETIPFNAFIDLATINGLDGLQQEKQWECSRQAGYFGTLVQNWRQFDPERVKATVVPECLASMKVGFVHADNAVTSMTFYLFDHRFAIESHAIDIAPFFAPPEPATGDVPKL